MEAFLIDSNCRHQAYIDSIRKVILAAPPLHLLIGLTYFCDLDIRSNDRLGALVMLWWAELFKASSASGALHVNRSLNVNFT